jgi:hypothetical protein
MRPISLELVYRILPSNAMAVAAVKKIYASEVCNVLRLQNSEVVIRNRIPYKDAMARSCTFRHNHLLLNKLSTVTRAATWMDGIQPCLQYAGFIRS